MCIWQKNGVYGHNYFEKHVLTQYCTFIIFLRMEFEDFCRYFTDMVVCRLAEKSLLWPQTHWREVCCQGAWTYASGIQPPPSSSCHLNIKNQRPSTGLQWSKQRPAQRQDKKEQRLSERQKEGQIQGQKQKKKEVKPKQIKGRREHVKKQAEGMEMRWERKIDRRSRCGGCINHRDTFLYNPQVNHSGNFQTKNDIEA